MIAPPHRSPIHPDRPIECEEKLAPVLDRLVDEAVVAGWSAAEVEAALLAVALARLAARKANVDTEEEIRKAWARVHGDA